MLHDDAIGIAARIGLWGCLAAIAFVTLSPITLRPHVAGLQMEHFLAFGLVGFLAAFAHPRRLLTTLLLIVLAAGCLEAAQYFVPGRHARMVDFAFKAIGCGVGFGIGCAARSGMRIAGRSRAL